MVEVVTRYQAKKVISILQSGYLPYVGFFELMARCDLFVLYDDVQYDKNSWRNRNQIRVPQGAMWLTVPVLIKGFFGQSIREVKIAGNDWKKKHLKSLQHYYSKAKYYAQYIGFFENLYSSKWETLANLNLNAIDYCRKVLGITAEIKLSSDLKSKGQKTERIINICEELDADAYISTNGAKKYLDEALFKKKEISLAYQNYNTPHYTQVYPGFVENLSIADVLFNCGEKSMDVILSASQCPFNRSGNYRGLVNKVD